MPPEQRAVAVQINLRSRRREAKLEPGHATVPSVGRLVAGSAEVTGDDMVRMRRLDPVGYMAMPCWHPGCQREAKTCVSRPS